MLGTLDDQGNFVPATSADPTQEVDADRQRILAGLGVSNLGNVYNLMQGLRGGEEIELARPQTHDLLKNFMKNLGARLLACFRLLLIKMQQQHKRIYNWKFWIIEIGR